MIQRIPKFLRCLLLPACLFLAALAARADAVNADIYGTWKVVAIVGGGITSMNTRQMNNIIGKTLFVSAERFTFNGKTCMNPSYKRSVEDTADYFYREWRVNSEGMPFGENVTVVETGDCNELYLTRKDHIIVSEDAIFYEATREGVKSDTLPPPARKTMKDTKNADIFGTWQIDGADWKGSGYDSEATKKKKAGIYLGMPVYISAKRFFYNWNTCKQPTYKRSRQAKAAYFHGDWRAAKGRLLFLPNILTVVETGCGTIYPISNKLIIIEDKRGMFFSAVPPAREPAS
jgi:hypothetical protein